MVCKDSKILSQGWSAVLEVDASACNIYKFILSICPLSLCYKYLFKIIDFFSLFCFKSQQKIHSELSSLQDLDPFISQKARLYVAVGIQEPNLS